MTIHFVDIEAIVAAIDAADTVLKTVVHAWTTEPVDDLKTEAPAAFPYLSGESASESDTDNDTRQQTVATVSVITVAKFADLNAARKQVFDALFGYQQSDEFHQTEHAGGGLAGRGLVGGYVWWKDSFLMQFRRVKS